MLCGKRPASADALRPRVSQLLAVLCDDHFARLFHGVKFAVTYIGEVLGNPTGGLKRGSIYRSNIARTSRRSSSNVGTASRLRRDESRAGNAARQQASSRCISGKVRRQRRRYMLPSQGWS
jgi:hypothetical protein